MLAAQLVAIARAWTDELRDAIQAARGEEGGLDAFRIWRDAFPPAYQGDVSPDEAVADIATLERLDPAGDLEIRLVHDRDGDDDGLARLKLYRSGRQLVLSDVMPVLDQLDVVVVDERPYEITAADALDRPRWIYSFGVHAASGVRLDDPDLQARVAELFLGVWSGSIENDGLNRLVIAAGLAPRDVVILRALAKYLHQAGVRFTDATLAATLANNAEPTRAIVELFHARLDPDVVGRCPRTLPTRSGAAIDAVASLDEDRLLRAFASVVGATVRTNAFLPGGWSTTGSRSSSTPRSSTSCPARDPPTRSGSRRPRRGGAPPRRRHRAWRDPLVGPARRLPHRGPRADEGADREERGDRARGRQRRVRREAPTGGHGAGWPFGHGAGPRPRSTARRGARVLPQLHPRPARPHRQPRRRRRAAPEGIVRHDGDDPYLVVAADKGTASFSDVANELADEYGYWLGDAFASGGSRGLRPQGDGHHRTRRVVLGARALPLTRTSTPTRPS